MKFHLLPIEIFPVDPGEQHVPVPERPLIGKIVHRHQRCDSCQSLATGTLNLEIGRDQTGRPIVTVEQIHIKRNLLDELQHSSGKKYESLAVIFVIGTCLTVDTIAIEIVVLADEVDFPLELDDFDWAARLDKTIKLVAQIDNNEEGFNARVYPVLIDQKHPLASIRGALNAVVVEGENIDQLVFSGPGAGADPTASAIVGDVLSACHQLGSNQSNWYPLRENKGNNRNFEDVQSSWFIRLSVNDEPGVLASIAGTFGEHNVSIESVIQEGRGDQAELVLVTHEAPEKDLNNSIEQITSLSAVTTVTSVLRVYI